MSILRRVQTDLLFDLRQILRSFARRPGLVLVSIVSLALGIGANAALFSVVDAVLFSGLPYRQSDRVVHLWETFQAPGGERWNGTVSPPNLRDWRERSRTLDFGAYAAGSANLTSDGTPERARTILVDGGVFTALGVEAARGRALTGEDCAGDGRVVLLSDALWRTRYGADPELVGRTIELGGQAYEVVGVMPAGFSFPPRSDTALWQPLVVTPEQQESRGNHWLRVVGRLRDGATLELARNEMDAIGAQLASEYPDAQGRRGVLIRSLHETVVGDARPVLYALWGAVGFVLLIACGNVAHLLLARATRRQQEMAVRAALGAGRSRLAALVLLESVLLAGAGGLLGLGLGQLTVARLARLPGSSLPAGSDVTLDARVFLYALAVGLLAALLAGAVPARRAARVDLTTALGAVRGSVGRRDRLRGLLVVAEVALALAVTLGAALMVRSLVNLARVDTGLKTDRVLTMSVPVPEELYPDDPARIAAFGRILDAVSGLPEVESAGWINLLPLQNWGWNGHMSVEGLPPLPDEEQPWVEYRVASADYFASLGIPVLAGRSFRPSDDLQAPAVVVVNQTMARTFWGERDPVGSRIGWASRPEKVRNWMQVVGVVADIHNAGLAASTRPEVYQASTQDVQSEMSLVVRTRAQTGASVDAIRRAIAAVDPLQPIYRVETMDEVLADHLATRRFDTRLLATFALLALVLAVVGVYSVMSYDAGLRRTEVGLRMALGADRARVLGLFLGRGTRLALAGCLLGGGIAVAATRLLENRLYGVAANDPSTFALGAAGLVLVAVVASLIPARRAAALAPSEALRDE